MHDVLILAIVYITGGILWLLSAVKLFENFATRTGTIHLILAILFFALGIRSSIRFYKIVKEDEARSEE